MYLGHSGSFPYDYSTINAYNSVVSPSTMHSRNTALSSYYRRRLLQRCISMFRWNLPENWDNDYFYYVLYMIGFIGVLNTDKFGIICQNCGVKGYNVFYRPTTAVYNNPLFRNTIEAKIGVNTEIIKLQPDWCGVMDLVNLYADWMAQITETSGVNLVNSKLSYVFAAGNKSMAESMKKMYDQIASGEPATFVDKQLFRNDGSPNWTPFSQNVGQNYIMDKLLIDLVKLINMFDAEIGIPNANTEKKERMTDDEVNARNVESFTNADLWLETLKKSIKKVNKMFSLKITVDWRVKPNVDKPDGDDKLRSND